MTLFDDYRQLAHPQIESATPRERNLAIAVNTLLEIIGSENRLRKASEEYMMKRYSEDLAALRTQNLSLKHELQRVQRLLADALEARNPQPQPTHKTIN